MALTCVLASVGVWAEAVVAAPVSVIVAIAHAAIWVFLIMFEPFHSRFMRTWRLNVLFVAQSDEVMASSVRHKLVGNFGYLYIVTHLAQSLAGLWCQLVGYRKLVLGASAACSFVC